MKMRFVYTAKEGSFTSWSIRKVSGGSFSHVAVSFMEDDGAQYYYESHWEKAEDPRKSGVRGPIPMSKMDAWDKKSPSNIVYYQDWLPIRIEDAIAAKLMLEDAVKTIYYGKTQIARNLLTCAGIRLGLASSSRKKKWTCSETGGRSIGDRNAMKLFKLGEFLWDDLFPSGVKGVGLSEVMEDWIKDARRNP